MNPIKHVAIIMDGNGRWGINRGKSRNFGHKAGIKTVEKIIKESLKKKIKNVDGRKLEEISFVITDFENEIEIFYVGILPDLFKEGQGVVVEGFLKNVGKFEAKTVLAKHDENYMPPEIKDIKSIKDNKT